MDSALRTLAEHGIARTRGMSWPTFLTELLRVGASLELRLMVQYLYGAYSLGGSQIPESCRDLVRGWQEALITTAREEMGHLLTVQNVLTFLGADVNFGIEFAWRIHYFNYEPLTLDSTACYVFAEMNATDSFPEKPEIEQRASSHLSVPASELLPVEELYTAIIALMGDEDKVPESALRFDTYPMQARWDDWGRGYRASPRSLDAEGNLLPGPQTPLTDRSIILIDTVASRTQAVEALKALATQGEGPEYPKRLGRRPWDTFANTAEGQDPREASHFARLIKVFREMKQAGADKWSGSQNAPTNPSTAELPGTTYISARRSRDWADLFNMRFRMLLTCLAHTFRLARITPPDEPSARAVTMHRAFGEMYNLKTIAGILFRLPLTDDPADNRRAGPPFSMPATFSLPPSERDCWCVHLDYLEQAGQIARDILHEETLPANKAYIQSLLEIDAQRIEQIQAILTA